MAGSRSVIPSRVSQDHAVRHFTVAMANRTLPLVKRIVADIVKCHAAVTVQEKAVDAAGTGPAAARTRTAAEAELQAGVVRLKSLVEELEDIGAEVKDFRTGLIDFLGKHQGRDVCLCWRLGEEKVGYWHEMKAGYAGRRPVATLIETA